MDNLDELKTESADRRPRRRRQPDAGSGARRRARQEGSHHGDDEDPRCGLDPDARKATGQALNALRDEVQAAIEARKAERWRRRTLTPACHRDSSTSPCRRARTRWPLHPITQTYRGSHPRSSARWASRSPRGRISRPTGTTSRRSTSRREHPARQMFDTFYMAGLRRSARGRRVRASAQTSSRRHHARRSRARGHAAAHPHLAGADPHHGDHQAADPRALRRAAPTAATRT